MNMQEQQIIEGNKIIAEFMGVTKRLYGDAGITYYIGGMPYQIFELEFHVSWDWLMPVVEEIQNLGYVVCIYGNYCFIQDKSSFVSTTLPKVYYEHYSHILNNALEAVYLCVVAFIEWHNKNK